MTIGRTQRFQLSPPATSPAPTPDAPAFGKPPAAQMPTDRFETPKFEFPQPRAHRALPKGLERFLPQPDEPPTPDPGRSWRRRPLYRPFPGPRGPIGDPRIAPMYGSTISDPPVRAMYGSTIADPPVRAIYGSTIRPGDEETPVIVPLGTQER